jgi:glycosyltransferase involved in cell wall biosynthesis
MTARNQPIATLATDPLVARDAFADYAHISSRLVIDGEDAREPLLTIAIPTFRRFDLLVEAVRSALAQRFERAIEVIVVDNDPGSDGATRLLEQLPELRHANFRYYLNPENIGMFGNWNRCIELGRGEWHTLLNDDDLLDADFTRVMFEALDGNSSIDALICRKRVLDERPGRATQPGGGPRRIAQRAWLEARFGGRATRRISARLLFWGGVIGNTVGLIARKRDLLEIGGYQPSEYPTADWYLQVRLAVQRRFHLHRAMLSSIRIGVNESMVPGMWKGFFRNGHRMHLMLAGTQVPNWWRHLSPPLLEIYRKDARDGLGQELSRDEVNRELGVQLRAIPRLAFSGLRLILRGF